MECRVLGSLEAWGEHGLIGLGGPQQRRLLAVLLSDPGRVLTYDRLVEVLWPDADDPRTARRSAITYVSRLRSALGAGVVQTTSAGYALVPGAASVDADRFVALLDQARSSPPDRAVGLLDEALALWRGPVFGDLQDEWWARPMVKRLDELRLTAMADRIDALTADGWDGRALAEARALVDAHPTREQFVDRAMRGLYALGQAAEAIRVFQSYREQLADLTGLDPSIDLVELERSIVIGGRLRPPSTDLARPLRGYVLHQLIGEGAVGAVYRATQPGVDRDVAVKVIRPELADDRDFIHRFEAEAHMVARLEHPHIVPLYDFWRQPGGAFLVLRLMRGGDGAELVARQGPLPLARVGEILDQVGSALVAAHAARVVHRDVKPSNVLFDDAGIAYLADFGIATSDTDVDAVGDGSLEDQRALAATLWHLLAGAPPATPEAPEVEVVGDVAAVRFDVPDSLAAVLSRAGAADAGDRFASVAEMIAAWHMALASETGRAEVVPSSPLLAIANPYKGLRPFDEVDAADFHGRSALVERLDELADGARFVAVVGPSGSGKSSLVRAGLIPRLRRRGCLVATMTPGSEPHAALSAALEVLASGDQAELLVPAALRRAGGMAAAAAAIGGTERLVLVVDQLEELWTMTTEADRRSFTAGLAVVATDRLAHVIVTVRGDFYDRPLDDRHLGHLVSEHTFAVTPMSVGELYEAITAPAERVGVRFEPALAGRLVAETSEQPASLPLLQFTLTELFESRRSGVLALDAYDRMGGIAGAVGQRAEQIFAALDASGQAATRRMYSRLVVPGDDSDDTRRRIVTTDLAGVSETVVDAFVEHRLISADRDRATRQPTIEIAHEVLLRSWPRLQGWLTEDRAWLRELRGLTSAAERWDASGRDDADLLGGVRLAAVCDLADRHRDAMTELERTYLQRSIERRDAEAIEAARRLDAEVRQNRRLRRALVGLALVAITALIAGSIALGQRQRADHQQRVADAQRIVAEDERSTAESERAAAQAAAADANRAATDAEAAKTGAELTTLASRSLSVRSSQRDLAALLAVEAWTRRPDAQSKSALFGTFTFDPGFLGYISLGDVPNVNGFVVPGTTDVVASSFLPGPDGHFGPVRVIDAITGTVGVQLDPVFGPDDRVLRLVVGVSGDGTRAVVIATTSFDLAPARAAVFDLATGAEVGPPIDLPTMRASMALDRTGSVLVVQAGDHGEATVYDVASGAQVGAVPAVPDAPPETGLASSGAFAFAPDGRLFAGSLGTHLRVFEPGTWRLVGDLAVPQYSTAGLIRFSADGSTLVTQGVWYDPGVGGVQHGSIARIDVATGNTLWQVSGHDYGYGECASFAVSEATDRLWCGNYFGLIRERSLSTGLRTGATLVNQKGWITDLELVDAPIGSVLIGMGRNSGNISRWSVDGGGAIAHRVAGDREILGQLDDGHRLVVGTPNGGVYPFDVDYALWDATSDTEITDAPTMLYARAVGPMVIGMFADGTIGTFDPHTGAVVANRIDLPATPHTSTATRDGSHLALGYDDGTVAVYEVATGRETGHLTVTGAHGEAIPIQELDLSDDASTVYVAGFGLWAFDIATGRQLAHDSDDALSSVALGPPGTIVVGRVDGTIAVFDAETLVEIRSLPGAGGFVQFMYSSTDGSILLGRGNDGSVSLYDTAAGVRLGDQIELGTLPQCTCDTVSLRSDGLEAGLPGPEGKGVILWDLQPEHWVTAACAIAGRNLTKQEWDTYVGDLGAYEATCPEYPAGG